MSALGGVWAAAATLLAPGARALLRARQRRGKEIAGRIGERWGEDRTPRPAGRLLWLHAASVGETVSALPLLAAFPDDVTVLMTTGTTTSAELLNRRLGLGLEQRVLHRFAPWDVPGWVSRFLDHWRPDAAAFVESELWPNIVAGCAARRIPMALINARMSAKSFRGWQRVRGFAAEMLGRFALIRAQSEEDAARLRALGAREVSAPGNLKFAAPPLPAREEEVAGLTGRIAGRPAWLAASTHRGEEAAMFEVHRMLAPRHPGLLTVIVPRHPERGAEIAALAGGTAVARRALGEAPPAEGVWIADTLGELGLLYRAIRIVFVGRSLGARGGQNPLEPARLGCAVAVGPHTENFAAAVESLAAAGALAHVDDVAALADWVDAMLRDPEACAAAGRAGMSASARYASLPGETAAALLALMPPR